DSVVPRFLAASPIRKNERGKAGCRKDSAFCFVDRFGDCDADRATRRHCSNCAFAAELAGRERAIGLSHLYLANDLAGESRDDLSASRAVANVANNWRSRASRFDYDRGRRSSKASAVFYH